MTTEKFGTYSYLLDRTNRKIKQYAQGKFKVENFDITVDQWLILKNLSIGKDHPTLTRIIDLLVKKNLVKRKACEGDRRSFFIHLTKFGIQKQNEWAPKVAEIRTKAWENLSEKDYEDLKRILNTIYQSLS
jgi:DNA-binding MarR family transcriptional regulator